MGALVVQLGGKGGKLISENSDFTRKRFFLLGLTGELLTDFTKFTFLCLDIGLSSVIIFLGALKVLLVLLEVVFLGVELILAVAEVLTGLVD